MKFIRAFKRYIQSTYRRDFFSASRPCTVPSAQKFFIHPFQMAASFLTFQHNANTRKYIFSHHIFIFLFVVVLEIEPTVSHIHKNYPAFYHFLRGGCDTWQCSEAQGSVSELSPGLPDVFYISYPFELPFRP